VPKGQDQYVAMAPTTRNESRSRSRSPPPPERRSLVQAAAPAVGFEAAAAAAAPAARAPAAAPAARAPVAAPTAPAPAAAPGARAPAAAPIARAAGASGNGARGAEPAPRGSGRDLPVRLSVDGALASFNSKDLHMKKVTIGAAALFPCIGYVPKLWHVFPK
jgi:hypothetical protein